MSSSCGLAQLLAAFVLAGMTGCSQPASNASVQACTRERVADLPMAPGNVWPVVVAALDGQAVSMLLDTGSERLGVGGRAALQLRLPQDLRHRTRMHGIGGDSIAYDVDIQSFELGGAEIPQSGAAIIELAGAPATRPPVAGVIGAQILDDYDVELDFIRRHVVLWQVSGCANVMPSWQGTWSSARLTRGAGDLVSLDIQINGKPIRALLDSGAQTTTIDYGTAGQLGLTKVALAASREVVTRGSDGSDLMAHVIRVQDIAVGSTHSADFPLLVSRIHLRFANMLLGADFLQHRDVWISYAGQQIFLR